MNAPGSAIVLAGGRSSRLGGVPKALLFTGQRVPLVRRVVDAVLERGTAPEAVVVVGPEELASQLPRSVRLVQERPRFSGPAAAIAAGARALREAGPVGTRAEPHTVAHAGPPAWTLLLSCDLADPAAALAALLREGLPGSPAPEAAPSGRDLHGQPREAGQSRRAGENGAGGNAQTTPGDGPRDMLVAFTDRPQPLVSAVRTAALHAVTAGPADAFADAPVRALTQQLRMTTVDVPEAAIRDVDTWDDVQREGLLTRDAAGRFVPAVRPPAPPPEHPQAPRTL